MKNSAKIEYLLWENSQMKEKIKYCEEKQSKRNLVFFNIEEVGNHEYEMDS